MITVLTAWSFEPTVIIGLVLSAVLYWRGAKSLSLTVAGTRRAAVRRWQAACFGAGLVVIFVALESPIDAYNGRLFWAHMIQHLLLIMIAAPLLSLGDPAVPLLRGIPLAVRRRVLKAAAKQSWIRRLGSAIGWLGSPVPAFSIFIVDLYFWHLGIMFNLTLQNQVVHDVEHVCFIVTALLFWSQVIDQRPMHARLSYGRRAVYVVVTGFTTNLLALYFVFSTHPIYSMYARLLHRPNGLSVVADQQYAGVIMWIPGLMLFAVAFAACLFKALDEDDELAPTLTVNTQPYSLVTRAADAMPVRLTR